MENTIKQIRKFKTDAIYGKKRHYNAAVRKRKNNNRIIIAQIVISAVTGTSLLSVVFGQGNKVAEVIALLLTVITTILAGLQKMLKLEEQATGNIKAADMYLRITKNINMVLALIEDNKLSEKNIIAELKKIANSISDANEVASQFSTNDHDYQEARKGIQDGEETYTDKDLNLC